MNQLSNTDQEIIQSGLQKVEDACNQIITQYYLDDDKTEMVKMANKIFIIVCTLKPIFLGNSDLYVLSEEELLAIRAPLTGMAEKASE